MTHLTGKKTVSPTPKNLVTPLENIDLIFISPPEKFDIYIDVQISKISFVEP